MTLDEAITFFRHYVELDRAARDGYRVNDLDAIGAAIALLLPSPKGTPLRQTAAPQPWGSGPKVYAKMTPEELAAERAAIAAKPALPRLIFAVEVRDHKEGRFASAWAGAEDGRLDTGISQRLVAGTFDGKTLLCQTAGATGDGAKWAGVQGMAIKGVGKVVAARRFLELPSHTSFYEAWSKLPT